MVSAVMGSLSVALGKTLGFVLLADGIAVNGTLMQAGHTKQYLGAVHDFFGQALSDGLDFAEGSLTSTRGHHVNCRIHSPQWGHFDCLSLNNTTDLDTSGVFAGSAILDGLNDNLQGVFASHQADDLEGLLDDFDGHELLSAVPSVHHERVGQALDEGAGDLTERALLVAASGMWEEHLG